VGKNCPIPNLEHKLVITRKSVRRYCPVPRVGGISSKDADLKHRMKAVIGPPKTDYPTYFFGRPSAVMKKFAQDDR